MRPIDTVLRWVVLGFTTASVITGSVGLAIDHSGLIRASIYPSWIAVAAMLFGAPFSYHLRHSRLALLFAVAAFLWHFAAVILT